jgi:hypothetical protein
MQEALLTVIVPPDLEEPMVDWLLEQNHLQGFSSMQVYGHGSGVSSMSLSEQVMGRQKRTQFMVHAELSVLEALLKDLRKQYANAGMHYLLTPVISSGSIVAQTDD